MSDATLEAIKQKRLAELAGRYGVRSGVRRHAPSPVLLRLSALAGPDTAVEGAACRRGGEAAARSELAAGAGQARCRRSPGPSPDPASLCSAEEQQRAAALAGLLQPEARERLARIALVKPDKARGVENLLLQAAQRGQLGSQQVTDAQLLGMLEKMSEGSAPKATTARPPVGSLAWPCYTGWLTRARRRSRGDGGTYSTTTRLRRRPQPRDTTARTTDFLAGPGAPHAAALARFEPCAVLHPHTRTGSVVNAHPRRSSRWQGRARLSPCSTVLWRRSALAGYKRAPPPRFTF